MENDTSSDMAYKFGNEILFDISANKRCYQESTTCIKTNVIDTNNKRGDDTVTLLPKISNIPDDQVSDINTILESKVTWNATTRLLSIQDVLLPISKDVTSSVLVRDGISDLVIGNLDYEGRMNKVILNAINSNNNSNNSNCGCNNRSYNRRF